MAISYKPQSTSFLCYHLFDKEIDVSQYKVLRTININWQGYAMKLGILGSSHFMQINKNTKHYTELVTCEPMPNPPAFLKQIHFNKNRPSYENEMMPFHFNAAFLPIYESQQGAYSWNEHQENVLVYRFPSPFLQANTYLKFDYDTTAFQLESIHEYPDEKLAFYTKTQFSLEDLNEY